MSKDELDQLEGIASEFDAFYRFGTPMIPAEFDAGRIRKAIAELTRLSALNRELVGFVERCAGNDHLNPELWREMCQMNARAILAKTKGPQ